MRRRRGDTPQFPGKVRALFLTRRRRPEAPGPALEARGRKEGFRLECTDKGISLKKINKNKKIQSRAGGFGARINSVGVATQEDLSPRGPTATRAPVD